MTNTNTQFESKEHYLAFRKAWSNAVNSDKAKTHYEERTYTSRSSRTVEKYRIDGWVTGAHHVLYNILRNRPFHKGFTMINIEKALMNKQLGYGRRVLSVLEEHGVSFEHMPTGIDTP